MNRRYREFAQLLANTSNNACLSILAAVESGERQLPTCAQRRLLAQCSGLRYRNPALKSLDFRSWAVAYGRSGFEFAMFDQSQAGLYDFTSSAAARLSVRGPLVISDQIPVWDRPLRVDGVMASGIERAILVGNDGGGNLNLQVEFKGEPKSVTRVSLTTLIEDTRFNSERMVGQAAGMPGVEMDDDSDTDGNAPMPGEPVEPPVEHIPEGDLG